MDKKIDGIDEIKRQVHKQIESEEKEYVEEVTENPDKDSLAGFSSTNWQELCNQLPNYY
jgi:hypothetical protein